MLNKNCLGDNLFYTFGFGLSFTDPVTANWWQRWDCNYSYICNLNHSYPEETRKKNLVPEKYWIFFSTTFLYFLTVQSYKTLYRHYFAKWDLVKYFGI